MPSSLTHRTRSAFSLIEAAIVLGIVGLVMAGVWTAAVAARDNYRLAATLEGLQFIVLNLQKNISRQDSVAIGNGYDMAFLITDSNWAPQNWVVNRQIYPPITQGQYFLRLYFYNQDYGNPSFDVVLAGMSKPLCIRFLKAMLRNVRIGTLNSGEIFRAQVTPGSFVTTTFPYTVTGSECTSVDNNTVSFKYGYTH